MSDRRPGLVVREPVGSPLAAGRPSTVRDAAPEMLIVGGHAVRLADGRSACTVAVHGYPRDVEAGWLDALLQFPGECRVAQHVEPIDSASALAELDRDLRGARASQLLADLRGAQPDALDAAAVADASALREALARGEVRLFRHHLLVTVFASDQYELTRRTADVVAVLRSRLLVARRCLLQQAPGLAATMPLGLCALPCPRNLDSEAVAASLPFGAGEFQEGPGEFWGLDVRRATPVQVDRFALPNPHLVVLGGSGSGKSFWMKHLLAQNLLAGRRTAVLDPQGEYGPWCLAMGGTLVGRDASGGGLALNPLAPPRGGGPDAARWPAARVGRAVALLQVLSGTAAVDPGVVSAAMGEACARSGDRPTLPLLAEALLGGGPPAGDLGRRLEAALQGALRGFAGGGGGQDGPETLGHTVVFDLREVVGGPPSPAASAAYLLLTRYVLDHLVAPDLPPLTLAVDEAHHLLAEPVAARFVEVLFRTGRKRGVAMCLATQSAGDLIGAEAQPEAARASRAALANAAVAFLMRQQNGREVDAVRHLYRLGRGEAEWLLGCAQGEGLLIAGPRRVLVAVEAPLGLAALFSTDPAAARPP